MKSIFLLVDRYIEPSFRRQLVEELLRRNMPRSKISTCLGISLSLITRYVKRERGVYDIKSREIEEEIKKLASRIVEYELCGMEVDYELARIILYALSRKYVCAKHSEIDESIDPAKCYICPKLFGSLRI